ncbi:TRAP dicarboxylate transporter, DctM subunit, unknown substrate 3 [Dissulfuribacter thermophilus]|uniref:TRAP C4-dicarboxylate transport system permease DctM subunit domain-containing protein n=1 Tax=Dissulfuribacter thermophilus TaxID=1156395 RepID=A0A1B9F545_9BACT|nr:TRAP transporter large permease [Dissulfuribacter thermophilus]OCC14871.1 TRAP dicarboxylate transporter, DctM subunit, unknown substrate 3 [Dissulfuribacter thermophilus]
MDSISSGLYGVIILLLVLFFTRMPVGIAMAVVGFLGFWLEVGFRPAVSMISSNLWSLFSSYGLSVVPFFVFMGAVCVHAGVSRRLYETAHAWIGHVRGGIAMATVLACAAFSAICGSNAATAATMSSVALPEMKRLGYDPALSTGSVASGATLGVLIPPSVVLIVIGLATEQSITKLFLAAIIPGLVITFLLALSVWIVCRIRPEWGPPGKRATFRERMKSLPGSIEMLCLFCFVMIGLYLGWFTPTEAGAAGSFFALLIVILNGHFNLKVMWNAIEDTVRTTCMIYIVVAGAVIFGRFLAVTRLPFEMADWVASLNVPNYIVLITMFLLYIVGGAIMDALGLLMITIPIFFPVVNNIGYDALWFSIVVTVITTLGAITPPVGINTFVVASVARDTDLETVFKGTLFFIPAYIFAIVLFTLFPKIVTLWY